MVGKMMREDFSKVNLFYAENEGSPTFFFELQIDHQLDAWHCSKNLTKKLTAKANTKGCEALMQWIRAISNHLWYSASTCKKNAQLLKWVKVIHNALKCSSFQFFFREKWLSVLHHVAGVHSWSGGQKFNKCDHGPMSDAPPGMEVAYLKRTSPAFKALKDVVSAPALLKLLPKLTKFCHTGTLEVFHSFLLRFCSKRQYFPYPGNLQ